MMMLMPTWVLPWCGAVPTPAHVAPVVPFNNEFRPPPGAHAGLLVLGAALWEPVLPRRTRPRALAGSASLSSIDLLAIDSLEPAMLNDDPVEPALAALPGAPCTPERRPVPFQRPPPGRGCTGEGLLHGPRLACAVDLLALSGFPHLSVRVLCPDEPVLRPMALPQCAAGGEAPLCT